MNTFTLEEEHIYLAEWIEVLCALRRDQGAQGGWRQ